MPSVLLPHHPGPLHQARNDVDFSSLGCCCNIHFNGQLISFIKNSFIFISVPVKICTLCMFTDFLGLPITVDEYIAKLKEKIDKKLPSTQILPGM